MVSKSAPEWTMSVADFQTPRGSSLKERCAPYLDYVTRRRNCGTWWVGRVLASRTGSRAQISDENGQHPVTMVNFGSQDYLGLSTHPMVKSAAAAAIESWGVHSAGSPVLIGRTALLLEVEQTLSRALSKEAMTLFATGWAAGFGIVTALVQPEDHVVMDVLAHNCLQNGARHVTQNIIRFRHNDLNHLEECLSSLRAAHPRGGIFLITESLFSMDSDTPDLVGLMKLARKYEAITILDIAHDFGALGKEGLGFLEAVPLELRPEIIMGSFSKTFGANGGFIASSREVKDYLALQAHSLAFSNAISPIQTAVVAECLRIAFSEEGALLREKLMANVRQMREGMQKQGFEVSGIPSAIVPVFVGQEWLARMTYTRLIQAGLQANLVEFPGVAKGRARFRFQLMATHDPHDIDWACGQMASAKSTSERLWNEST